MKYLLLIPVLLSLSGHSQIKSGVNKSLDTLFQNMFKPGEPGAAVLIAKRNKIIYKNAFGIADVGTLEPITTQTLFNIGSISKTFVAYGILQLAREGKLSLEDDLYKYFPDFKVTEIAKKVKLYHLLTHSSGLPDSRRVKEEHSFYLTAKDEENWAPIKQTEKLDFEPGTQYKYSNPAFNALALIIEKVSGKKWQEYITQTIFIPADMQLSTITDGPHPESGVSHGYILNKEKKWEELDYGEEPTFAAAGNGGVWSSVDELWKYEQAIQGSVFLPGEWIKKSRSIYPLADFAASRLGLSWFLTKESGLDLIGHTGSQGGFTSDYVWLPAKQIFYVFLSNIPKQVGEVRRAVFKILEEGGW